MYKLRFHLAQGKNYKKWQVVHPDKSKTYHDPQETVFTLKNCKLRIQPSAARKIFNGANREVCAWIECDGLESKFSDFTSYNMQELEYKHERLRFNPKVAPNWTSSLHDQSADNQELQELSTYGVAIFNPS